MLKRAINLSRDNRGCGELSRLKRVVDVTVEDCTHHGRLDMTLKFNQQVYLFEFNLVELAPQGNALQQIKERGYVEKYQALQQPIDLIGVEFSKDNRNSVAFEVEQI